MKEVFLYTCMKCGNVVCMSHDRGEKFYLDHCYVCKDLSDFERVYVARELNMYKESHFLVDGEEDGDKKG